MRNFVGREKILATDSMKIHCDSALQSDFHPKYVRRRMKLLLREQRKRLTWRMVRLLALTKDQDSGFRPKRHSAAVREHGACIHVDAYSYSIEYTGGWRPDMQ